ncbi:MAG: hypothetical protein JXR95_01000 [Deltaproteobacteria bacterium]|nr:hypothetical protein [Deltaproteobacteria bacterium]
MKFPIGISIFLLLVVSCARNTDSGELSKSNTVVVSWSKDITTLDPACADGWESAEVISQIYEGLVYEDPENHTVKMRLAESIKSSENGLIWDVKVRKGVKFHDGTPMDANAVAYSFQRQINAVKNGTTHYNCAFSYWKAYFNMIEGVKVTSEFSVRFTLKYNYAPFLKMLEIFAVFIVRPSSGESVDYIDKNPIGTGPFKLKKRMEGRVVLERNSSYWNDDMKPTYKYLVFQTIPENRQRMLALEGGQTDIAYHLDPGRYLSIGLHPGLKIKKIQSVNIAYLALNTSRPPFSIKQNRVAVNHLIDRDKIVKMVYQGTGELANAPIPPFLELDGKSIYKKDFWWYKHDRQKAQELFKAGGYVGASRNKPLNLYVIRSPRGTLPNPILMANLIRNDFKKAGIEVKVHALEYRDYKNALRSGKHDMAIHSWIGDLWDPDNFLFGLLHSSSTGTNYSRFNNTSYDAAVYTARSVDKSEKRAVTYLKALKIFRDEAPWVPLAFSRVVVTYSRRLKNFKHNMDTTSLYNLVRLRDK